MLKESKKMLKGCKKMVKRSKKMLRGNWHLRAIVDTTSFQTVYKFFTCLEMPVNITQYRGSVGIFNNRNFPFRPQVLERKSLIFQTTSSGISIEFSTVFAFVVIVLSPRCSFFITSRNTCASNAGYYLCFTIRLSVA